MADFVFCFFFSVVSYVTFLKRTTAAVVIQKNVRMWAARRSYQQQRSAAVTIQSFLRAHMARKKFHQVTHQQHRSRSQDSWFRKEMSVADVSGDA